MGLQPYKVVAEFTSHGKRIKPPGYWTPPNHEVAERLVAAGCLRAVAGEPGASSSGGGEPAQTIPPEASSGAAGESPASGGADGVPSPEASSGAGGDSPAVAGSEAGASPDAWADDASRSSAAADSPGGDPRPQPEVAGAPVADGGSSGGAPAARSGGRKSKRRGAGG